MSEQPVSTLGAPNRREDHRASELRQRALRRIPGGVNSTVRLPVAARFFERGAGAWLWDVDGQSYIDYLLGQGPAFLGHAHPAVLSAVAQAARNGSVFGAQHELEVEAAEALCDALVWPDMVRIGSTGTEAVQAAMRLARAVTGNRKIVRFIGHYHGWLDNILLTETGEAASKGQIVHFEDVITIEWNDFELLASTLEDHRGDVAAVLMEPVMMNAGVIEPADRFLQRAKELCGRHKCLLIFDETISGFRIGLGGAAERFEVAPDLATYGKAMAGGWPVAALAGRREVMESLSSGSIVHAGTFNANTMSCAAVIATLNELRQPDVYEQVESTGKELMAGLESLAREVSVPLRLQGYGQVFFASLGGTARPLQSYSELATRDVDGYAALVHLLARHGVWVAARGVWYLSLAHGRGELDETLSRASQAFKAFDHQSP